MGGHALSFIERHVEKVIVGVTAVLLLVAIVLFGVRSPTRTEAGGQTYGAGELDRELIRARMETLQQRLASAEPKVEPVPDYLPLFRDAVTDVLRVAGTPPVLPPLAMWDREIPEAAEAQLAGTSGPVRLPEVIPPPQPVAYGGRAAFALSPLPELTYAEAPVPSLKLRREDFDEMWRSPTTVVRDVPWVTVATRFPLDDQLEKFRAANWSAGQLRVYIVRLEAQRQRMTPLGRWSPPEPVAGFTLYRPLEPPTVTIEVDESGIQRLPGDQSKALSDFRDLLEKAQPTIRRPLPPGFFMYAASCLGGGEPWTLPPFDDVDWAALDAAAGSAAGGQSATFLALRDLPPYTSRCDQQKQPEAENLPPRVLARRKLERARKLATSDKLADVRQAETLLNEAIESGLLSRSDQAQAEALLAEVMRRRMELQRQAREPAAETGAPARRYDVLWVHDLDLPEAGTYRYRLRVVLYNNYAGNIASLADPADATRVLLEGPWSAWSAPVTLPPAEAFFVKRVRPDRDPPQAEFEVYKWVRGDLATAEFDVPLGEVIGGVQIVPIWDARKGQMIDWPVDFSTGARLIGFLPERPVIRYRAHSRGGFSLSETTTEGVICLTPEGQVIERTVESDREPLRRWRALANEAAAAREAARSRPPGATGRSGGRPRP